MTAADDAWPGQEWPGQEQPQAQAWPGQEWPGQEQPAAPERRPFFQQLGMDFTRGLAQTRQGQAALGGDVATRFGDTRAQLAQPGAVGAFARVIQQETPEQRAQAEGNVQAAVQQAVEGVAAQAPVIEANPPDPVIQQIAQAPTFGDAATAFLESPGRAITGVLAQSAPQMLATLAAGAVNPLLGVAVGGGSSAVNEYGSALTEVMRERGVDLSDAAAVQAALQNPEIMEEARRKGLIRGGIIGTADAASGGIASRTLLPARVLASRPVAREAASTLAVQPVAQAALAGGAEATAQRATGEWKPGEIFLEMIGEAGSAPADAAAFGRQRISGVIRDRIAARREAAGSDANAPITADEVEAVVLPEDLAALAAANNIPADDPRLAVLRDRLTARRAAEADPMVAARARVERGPPGERATPDERRDFDAADRAVQSNDPASLGPQRQQPASFSVTPSGAAVPLDAEGRMTDEARSINEGIRGRARPEGYGALVPTEPQPNRMTPDEIRRAAARNDAVSRRGEGETGGTVAPPDPTSFNDRDEYEAALREWMNVSMRAFDAGTRLTGSETRLPQTPSDVERQRQAGESFTLAERQAGRAPDAPFDTQPGGMPQGPQPEPVALHNGIPVRVVAASNDGKTLMVVRYDPRTGQVEEGAQPYPVPRSEMRMANYTPEPSRAQDATRRAEVGRVNTGRAQGRRIDQVQGLPPQTYRMTPGDSVDINEPRMSPPPRNEGDAPQAPVDRGDPRMQRAARPEQPEPNPESWMSGRERAWRAYQSQREAEADARRKQEEFRQQQQSGRRAEPPPKGAKGSSTNTPKPAENGDYQVDAAGYVVSTGGGPIIFGDHVQAARWIMRAQAEGRQVFEVVVHPNATGRERSPPMSVLYRGRPTGFNEQASSAEAGPQAQSAPPPPRQEPADSAPRLLSPPAAEQAAPPAGGPPAPPAGGERANPVAEGDPRLRPVPGGQFGMASTLLLTASTRERMAETAPTPKVAQELRESAAELRLQALEEARQRGATQADIDEMLADVAARDAATRRERQAAQEPAAIRQRAVELLRGGDSVIAGRVEQGLRERGFTPDEIAEVRREAGLAGGAASSELPPMSAEEQRRDSLIRQIQRLDEQERTASPKKAAEIRKQADALRAEVRDMDKADAQRVLEKGAALDAARRKTPAGPTIEQRIDAREAAAEGPALPDPELAAEYVRTRFPEVAQAVEDTARAEAAVAASKTYGSPEDVAARQARDEAGAKEAAAITGAQASTGDYDTYFNRGVSELRDAARQAARPGPAAEPVSAVGDPGPHPTMVRAEAPAPPPPGERPPAQDMLLICSCSDSKSDVPGEVPAVERYTGSWFQQIKQLPPDARPTVLIVSGKFGLISGDTPIPSYNQPLNKERATAVADDDETSGRLQQFLEDGEFNRVVIVAGGEYRRALAPHLEAAADFMPGDVRDIRGRGIGDMKSELGRLLLNNSITAEQRREEAGAAAPAEAATDTDPLSLWGALTDVQNAGLGREVAPGTRPDSPARQLLVSLGAVSRSNDGVETLTAAGRRLLAALSDRNGDFNDAGPDVVEAWQRGEEAAAAEPAAQPKPVSKAEQKRLGAAARDAAVAQIRAEIPRMREAEAKADELANAKARQAKNGPTAYERAMDSLLQPTTVTTKTARGRETTFTFPGGKGEDGNRILPSRQAEARAKAMERQAATTFYSNPLFDPAAWNRFLIQPLRQVLKGTTSLTKSVIDRMQRGINAVFASSDGRMRTVANEYSGKARDLIVEQLNMLHALAGAGRQAVGETYSAAVSFRLNTRLKRLEGLIQAAEADGVTSQQIRDAVTGTGTPTGAVARHAQAVRQFLQQELQYLKAAGVQIGNVGARYFPREFDIAAIMADEQGFLAAAEQAYQRTGLPVRDARIAAEKLLEDIQIGGKGRPGMETTGWGVASFTRERAFGPEADKLLSRYYVADLQRVLASYTHRAAMRAEIAKRFGDRFENWDTTRQALLQAGVKPDDVALLKAHIEAATGVAHSSLSYGAQNRLDAVRTYGTLGLLESATFINLAELVVAGAQANSLVDVARGLVTGLNQWQRELRGLDRDAKAELAELVGGLGGHGQNALMAARFAAGDINSSRQSEVLADFFKRIGLEQLTSATTTMAADVGRRYIAKLGEALAGGSKLMSPARAAYFLRELGVPDADHAAFGQYVQQLGTSGGVTTAQLGDAQWQNYRVALNRFIDQSRMRPDATMRPSWANGPLGAVVFQLASFSYAFQRQVINRAARVAGQSVARGQGYSLADRLLFAGPLLVGLPVILAVNMALQGLKGELGYEDPERDRRKTEGAKVEERLLQSGALGIAAPYAEVATAAAFGRNPTERALGPALGLASDVVNATGRQAMQNSASTNGTERQLARATYSGVVEPAANYALGRVASAGGVVGRVAASGAGTAVRGAATIGLGSPGARDAAVDAAAGEKRRSQVWRERNQPIESRVERLRRAFD